MLLRLMGLPASEICYALASVDEGTLEFVQCGGIGEKEHIIAVENVT